MTAVEENPVFYNYPLAFNPAKAKLALEEKGLKYTEKRIDLFQWPISGAMVYEAEPTRLEPNACDWEGDPHRVSGYHQMGRPAIGPSSRSGWRRWMRGTAISSPCPTALPAGCSDQAVVYREDQPGGAPVHREDQPGGVAVRRGQTILGGTCRRDIHRNATTG